MNRHTSRWMVALFLSASTALVAAYTLARADEDEDKKKARIAAAEALIKFTDSMPKMTAAEIKKEAEAMVRKHEMEAVMHQFKPRVRGGIGVGKLGEFKPGEDGLETKILAMAKRKMVVGDLDKQAPAIIRAMEVTNAIGEIAHFYKPKDKKPGMDPADWTKLTNEMQEGSKELIALLKAKEKDPVKIFEASKKLNNSCLECHATFRDAKP